MRGVITGGTGRRADVPGVPTLGKTGTTTSYRDAWFCGFTGNYVAAVWLGNDDYRPTNNLTGGTLPAIAWQKFMAYAHTNIDIKPVFGVDFVAPETVIVAETDDGAAPVAAPERPPALQPEAATKLLDLAERLKAALDITRPTTQAAVEPPSPQNESL
jgi:penicillin-binding protein 1A